MATFRTEVRVFPDLEILSHAAAAIIIEGFSRAVLERGRFLWALSGGKTPARLYQLLAQSPYREQADWPHLHAFWGDERCIPIDSQQNNFRQAQDLLLAKVPVPPENIHRIQSELDPEVAASDYGRVLQHFATPPLGWPRFDLVLLGLGEDGHTASIFPGSKTKAAVTSMAVYRKVENREPKRVTVTPVVFNAARRVVFLVSGSSKSRIVARVLEGQYEPRVLPAQRIHPTDGDLIWMLDKAAAAELRKL